MAYSPASGRRLWASHFSGPGGPGKFEDSPDAVAVSPDGRTVFVTGYAMGWGTSYDYATVAYSAAAGRQLWVSRYTGPGNNDDSANAVAVSPDGRTVFVTGQSPSRNGDLDFAYATVAYSAATGRQLWVSRYAGPGDDFAGAVAVSPDGATVLVTGTSGSPAASAAATVAYSAATGRQLWVSRYHGPAHSVASAGSVAVSPDGATVFVTGESRRTTGGSYLTIAYRAGTGRQLWASRYNGSSKGLSYASSMAVSPAGTTVYVTGESGHDYATVAYRAATGRRLWVSRYHGYEAQSVAVSPNGATVYVTGYGYSGAGYATVAYRAATGRQLWTGRYNGPENNDGADSVAVSPDGTTVYVTGWTETRTNYYYATVAYRG